MDDKSLRILIRFGMDKKGATQAIRELGKIEKKTKASGAAMGVAAGATMAMVDAVIQLGAAAAKAFFEIAQGGVEMNAQLETAGKVFGAVFGDPALGQETLKFLAEVSDELNIDKNLAIKFGQSILPKTDSLENFTELLRLTDIQADVTGKTVGELEFAIREALSGDFVSLKDQFDISKAQVQQIKDLTPTLGEAGALAAVIGEEFEKLGKVNITGTYQTDLKSLKADFADLQTAFGQPIFEALKEQFADIGDVIDERGDDFELMAAAIGDAVSAVVEFVGSGLTEFLQNLDTDQIIEVSNTVFEIIENLRVISDILGTAEVSPGFLDALQWIADTLSTATTAASQLSAMLKGVNASVDALVQEKGVGATLKAMAFGIEEDDRAITNDAFNESMRESLATMNESTQRIEENAQAQRDRTAAQENANAADTDAIDTQLQAKDALADSIKAEGEYTGALEKVEDKTKKLATQTERAREKALLASNQAQLDALTDFAREREDIMRDNTRALEDIGLKHRESILQSYKTLSKAEEDIAKDIVRDQTDLAKDQAQEKEEIERDHLRKVRDIRNQFQQDAEEAIRNQDAIAFLKAQRQRDNELTSASQSRQENLTDASEKAAQKREALKVEQQRSLEDAKLANQQRIEDLRQTLATELSEQQRKLEQDIQNQAIAEERKLQDLNLSLERRLSALRTADEERLTDLEKTLEKEYSLIEEYEKKKAALVGGGSSSTLSRSSPNRLLPNTKGAMASGGYADFGQYTLGEAGTEFVMTAGATRMAEQALGGQLTQGGLVGALSGGGIALTQNITIPEGVIDPQAIVTMIEQKTATLLEQYARG